MLRSTLVLTTFVFFTQNVHVTCIPQYIPILPETPAEEAQNAASQTPLNPREPANPATPSLTNETATPQVGTEIPIPTTPEPAANSEAAGAVDAITDNNTTEPAAAAAVSAAERQTTVYPETPGAAGAVDRRTTAVPPTTTVSSGTPESDFLTAETPVIVTLASPPGDGTDTGVAKRAASVVTFDKETTGLQLTSTAVTEDPNDARFPIIASYAEAAKSGLPETDSEARTQH